MKVFIIFMITMMSSAFALEPHELNLSDSTKIVNNYCDKNMSYKEKFVEFYDYEQINVYVKCNNLLIKLTSAVDSKLPKEQKNQLNIKKLQIESIIESKNKVKLNNFVQDHRKEIASVVLRRYYKSNQYVKEQKNVEDKRKKEVTLSTKNDNTIKDTHYDLIKKQNEIAKKLIENRL